MSKQVEKKGDTLHVRTSEAYEDVSKVICLKKGKTAKVFYPFMPSYLSIEEAYDFTVMGYKVGELVKFAEILRGKQIDEVNLRDYNDAFISGYQRAQDDIRKQIEDDIQRMFEEIGKQEENNGVKAEVQLSGDTQNN